ncbi:FprA family A-type flavoprotein [Infirmifilum lucidum]|uniref:FprA family A-type flavoprotein n=1 Tax=Infirmifilum lucidum TaxID=2776706 RepID=A0A7L9FFR7_9CREN|nr:FprA family A-type flavoprotein [Infirmifilum lucidum]QOJ78202.1 FprA family A-type flavoprotein [Infirmifilum lucidum]
MGIKTYIERVTDDLYVLRVDDANIEFFEALWEIPEKISYNAYLLVKEDHVVLFDGWKAEYSQLLLESIGKVIDPRGITEVVVHHVEPDHSGSIPEIARVSEKAVFLGHPLAGRMLSSFYGVRRFKPLQDGAVADFGVKARFIHTPWLHWPETAVTYLEDEGVLLSCDAFGSYSLPPLFDDQADFTGLERAARKYFATVIGHYAPFVSKALEKLNKLGVRPQIIAPGHGTIWRRNVDQVLKLYANLAGEELGGEATIVYVSMYGNVESAAQLVEKALKERGLKVNVYKFTDKARASMGDVLESISRSKIVVVGASTYESEVQPLMRYLLGIICEKFSYRKKLSFLVLSPYGWSGTGGKKLGEALRGFGFSRVEVVEWEGRLTDDVSKRMLDALERVL